jgi:hypothetical protein
MEKRKISCPWHKPIYRVSISRNIMNGLTISFDTDNKNVSTFCISLSKTIFIFVESEIITAVAIVACRPFAGQRPRDNQK